MIGRFVRLSAVTAAIAVLGGCSLLATPDPVQLYRFGAAAESGEGPVLSAPVQVALRRIEFPAASKGDRMLGITGAEAAYIAGARWVSTCMPRACMTPSCRRRPGSG